MSDGQDLPTTRPAGQDIYPRWHVKHRKTLLIAGIIAMTCVASWIIGLGWFGGEKQFRGEDSIAAVARGVEFRTDTPQVKVRPSPDGRVHLSIRGTYSGATPFMALTVEDERVLAVVNCFEEPLRECDLTVDLLVPPDLPLQAKSSSGMLDVAQLDSRLHLRSDSGQLTLTQLSNSVVVETLTGQVTGRGLSGPRFTVTGRQSPVSLALTEAPASISVNTGAESPVRLSMPPGRYRLDVDAGAGEVSLGRGIVRDPASGHFIRVLTQGSDVSLMVPAAA